MSKRTKLLIYAAALIIAIGVIFLAGKPELSSAQEAAPLSKQDAPFKTYILSVNCGNSQTATFFYEVPEKAMGNKEICAGRCPEGNVSLADALAPFPAGVSAAFRAKVAKHEEDAAAGKGKPLACLRDGKEKPPKAQPTPTPNCEAAGCEPPKDGGPKFKSSVNGYSFAPFADSPNDLIPQEVCPECLWELIVVDFTSRPSEEGSRIPMLNVPEKFKCVYRYLAVWRCPSNGRVVPRRSYKTIEENCRSPQG